MKRKISTGSVFGKWTTISELFSVPDASGNARRVCICRCECGIEKQVMGESLLRGLSNSCGCWRSEKTGARAAIINKTHGDSAGSKRTPEYMAWDSMKSRCNNPDHPDWDNYGGRGIKVCELWSESFESFLEDMKRRPSSKHSIDRYPDNNGNYEKTNCRWATWDEQARNRRNNHIITFRGETKNLTEWAESCGLTLTALSLRLHKGWTVERALTTKLQVHKRG